MGEVVRMKDARNQKHLDRIRERLERALILKADCIIGTVDTMTVDDANDIVENIVEEYNFYKEGYGL